MSRSYGQISERVKGVGVGNISVAVRQHSYGVKSVIDVVRLNAVSLLRDQLLAAGVVGCQRAVLIVLRKHL